MSSLEITDGFSCPKCKATSGDDWSQCEGSCPLHISPHYKHATPREGGLKEEAAWVDELTDLDKKVMSDLRVIPLKVDSGTITAFQEFANALEEFGRVIREEFGKTFNRRKK